ncbi:hypothetical protein K440DRAFT_252707 [Wilcoxina mikolae CBS 423.85]|nr:hypothetical protein K440DRAFT_252707 [Wilcoxina mikolae CBS 423.85]
MSAICWVPPTDMEKWLRDSKKYILIYNKMIYFINIYHLRQLIPLHLSFALSLFPSTHFRDWYIVHPPEMVPEIVHSAEAIGSLSWAAVHGTIFKVSLPVDVSDVTAKGSDVFTTVFALIPTRPMPID